MPIPKFPILFVSMALPEFRCGRLGYEIVADWAG